MRIFRNFWLFLLPLLLLGTARAQEVRIVSPQEGQDVRGEITARFEGIPAGGYALVKIDGQFRQASAQDFVILDTISDRVTFGRGDAAYRLEITVLNAGGKRVGTDTVTFNVANTKVDENSDSVRLVHWLADDRINGGVQRYRVFAESNAVISGGSAAGGGGGASPSAPGAIGGGASLGGGDAGGAASYIPAPLDWQVSALMRRVVRDTGLLSGSANIQTIIQEGFERQRLSEAGAGGGDAALGGAPAAGATAKRGKVAAPAAPTKAPWNQKPNGEAIWNPAPETGKYFIKMIQQNGTEINATRKAPSIAIADLLPTFPDVQVRPGSTWQTTMSLVGDLSTRLPVNVLAPITFSSYEDVQTPSGETRRCAKLESRFDLTENLAKRIAANLANKVGGSAGAAGGASAGAAPGALGGGDAAADAGLTEADIEVARARVARVLWFDVDRRRILRAEDTILANFEVPAAAADAGGAGGASMVTSAPMMPGGLAGGEGAGAAAAPAEPQTVAYNLKVTTWLDDRIPNPTGQYLPGGAGAHARDSVNEPGITRLLVPKR
ncbi:hypothetical protein EON80_01560 [bacterium]|nr:MAG: hypothetical protein EON80_01560 [bacterium]